MLIGGRREILKKKFGYVCAAGNFDYHPIAKTTDEADLQPIFCFPPINKLCTNSAVFATDP